MRVLRWVIGLALLAAVAAFVWAIFVPRRRVEPEFYVAPEPAEHQEVSVPEAEPLLVSGG